MAGFVVGGEWAITTSSTLTLFCFFRGEREGVGSLWLWLWE